MADANSFLLPRAPQHDQQYAHWQENESAAILGGPLILGERSRVFDHSSDYYLHHRAHIRSRQTTPVDVSDYTGVQPVSGPLRGKLVFGADPVPPIRPGGGEQGRPQGIVSAFVSVCERWNLARDAQCKLLGFPPGDFVAQELLGGGLSASSQDVRERVGYVVGISIALGGLFDRNHEAELAWLNQRRAKLDGKSPLQWMLQRRMINLVQVSELLREERGL